MAWMRQHRLVVLLIVTAVGAAACGGDDGEQTAIAVADETTTTTSETTATNENTATTEPATTTAPEEKDLVVEVGFTSGMDSINTRYTTAGAMIHNPNESFALYDARVVFNLIDAEGGIIDTDTSYIEYIPAGETVPVAPMQIGFDSDVEPTDIEGSVVGRYAEDTGWAGADSLFMRIGIDLDISDADLVPGDFDTNLGFTVTNPGDELVEMASWDCVLKFGGQIVGGESSAIIDPIIPGGSVRVDHYVSVDAVQADEIICRANG